jgi:uncharacterized protein (DUF1800 family)
MADPRVAHLLRRATFGPTAAEVEEAARAGYAATVERLLAPAGSDPGAARSPVPSLGPDPFAALTRQSTREDRQRAQQELRRQTQATLEWWLDRLVVAEHQLVEKLIFFWHGHWATSVRKVRSAALMLGQLGKFRELGRGDFGVLARAMVRDPALILWLDGQRNTLGAPNENLARELMELFTLGRGAYSEADVKQAARALTGWVIERATGAARFVPRRHAAGEKTILGVTAGFDADALVDLLLTRSENAAFLARRFWFRFGSGGEMAAATGERLAAAYRDGRDITALLRAVLTDPAFPGTAGQLVKQPVEWAVGALRQLGARPAELTEQRRRQLLVLLGGLDQVPLRPPSVGGWPAGAAWLTVSSLQARMRAAEALAAWAAEPVVADLSAVASAGRPDALARVLVVDAWTPRTRAVLAAAAGQPRHLIALGLVSPEYAVH